MQANTFIYNLTNSKKSVVLNQNGENNKVMKYIGGDNILYKNIFVQNENNLDYYGRIYEDGTTLNLESQSISLRGVNIEGDIVIPGEESSIKIGVPDDRVATLPDTRLFVAHKNNTSTSAIFQIGKLQDMGSTFDTERYHLSMGNERCLSCC
jgi:hypothetical protein